MAINVSQAFHRTSANPIDDTLTLTKAQMLTVNDNLMPSKYLTVCQDDGLIYLYAKSNSADPTTGKFRVLQAGGQSFVAVDTLPTTNIQTDVIYLVPKTVGTSVTDIKDEYINLDGTSSGWEYIGSTSIDLSDYVTNTALNTALSAYTPTSSLSDVAKAENVEITDLADGDILKYDATKEKFVNVPDESGGDSALTVDVTSNLAVGAIASGTTLPQGTTFTEFAQKLLITEIAPTTTFSASGSGVKEVGTSVTPTLTLTITGKGTGTPTSIKFYSGSTLLDTQAYVDGTNTYTYTMESAVTTTTTVKGVLEYKKSDVTTTATIEKSASYTFVMASYYGAVTTAPTDKAGIIALTKNVKNTKALTTTFTLSNQRSCYCYPASFGNLTSIKDANNFEYLSSYTKTNVTVDEVSYNVYTLTDPVTASGFKQVYA